MIREKQVTLYRILFFVFCAANFIFLNAFILYFEDPGRFAPAPDFLTVMIVFAGMETVLAAGTFYCLLRVIRLQREEGEGRDGDDDDLLSLPPKVPRARQKEEPPARPLTFTQSSPQNFEKLLRVLIMLVVVVGIIFVLFLLAVSLSSGAPADDIRPRVATVTAVQPDATTITVTYGGKQGEDRLMTMTARVTDSTGQVRTGTIGSETGSALLSPGDTITVHGSFAGEENVIVSGHFANGIDQVVLDTMV